MTSSPITVTDLYQESFPLSDTFGPLHFLNQSPETLSQMTKCQSCYVVAAVALVNHHVSDVMQLFPLRVCANFCGRPKPQLQT